VEGSHGRVAATLEAVFTALARRVARQPVSVKAGPSQLDSSHAYFAVQALDADGRALARSKTVAPAPA
jgi:hypothetical protein